MKTASTVLLSLVLVACAAPQAPVADDQHATLDVALASASTGTTNQSWTLTRYKDASCASNENGVQLGRIALGNHATAMPPVQLPAGVSTTVAFDYVEAGIGQTRQCSFSAAFTAAPNGHYRARFAVDRGASGCAVTITEAGGGDVKVVTPAVACAPIPAFWNTGVTKMQNGKPWTTNYQLQVTH